MGEWLMAAQEAKNPGSGHENHMQKSFNYYMKQNVYITTSGVFDQPVFECALAFLGIDNMMFSVDDPFRDNFEAMDFLNATKLSKEDKEKLAHGNADKILKLSNASGSSSNSNHSFSAFKARTKSKMGRMLLSFLVK